MSVDTLFQYLIGSESAIRAVAGNPWSLVLGLVFVFTTGIARSYRRFDLRRRPIMLAVPILASMAASACLFAVVCVVFVMRGAFPAALTGSNASGWPASLVAAYGAFLGLFWMTAPLAWVYGIPFERWVDRLDAAKLRLLSLLLVSVWRMLLLMRVLHVLLGFSGWAAAVIVMCFGDAVALTAIWVLRRRNSNDAPVPVIFGQMASISPTSRPEIALLNGVNRCVSVMGAWTLPLWLAGTLGVGLLSTGWRLLPQIEGGLASPPIGLSILALGSLFAWCLIAVGPQRKQRRATRVNELMAEGKTQRALDELSSRSQTDFPRQWRPPPGGDLFAPASRELLLNVVAAMARHPVQRWVREEYMALFREFLEAPLWFWFDDADLERVIKAIEPLPEAAALAAISSASIEQLVDSVRELRFSFPDDDDDDEQNQSEGGEQRGHPFGVEDRGMWMFSEPPWPKDTPERQALLESLKTLSDSTASDDTE